MSQTLLPGLVDESHWTFMAATMSESLTRMAGDRQVDSKDVPPAILDASREFFALVQGAIEGRNDLDHVGTASNYCIAARALRSTAAGLMDRSKLNQTLSSYAEVIESLTREPRALTTAEAEVLRAVASFFASIHSTGESKAYERFAGGAELDEI